MDWFSRYVIDWELSTTLDSDFCVRCLERALEKAAPEIFNTDQGVQYTRRGLHRDAARGRRSDQHERGWPLLRQHHGRTLVADGEAGGGVPEGLRRRTRLPRESGRVFFPTTTTADGIAAWARDRRRFTSRPIERRKIVFRFSRRGLCPRPRDFFRHGKKAPCGGEGRIGILTKKKKPRRVEVLKARVQRHFFGPVIPRQVASPHCLRPFHRTEKA